MNDVLFEDTDEGHHSSHRPDDRILCLNFVEVQLLELPKYNRGTGTLSDASELEQWAYFLLNAHLHDAATLRELLPGPEFQYAIAVLESIAAKSEDRIMYDQRSKAELDALWIRNAAREAGLEEGRKAGLEAGLEAGREAGREEGREAGREEGVVYGTIRTLQHVLGDQVSSLDDLAQLAPSTLDAIDART